MSVTAQTLIRELISRFDSLAISTPTSGGTTTTLIDTGLNEHFPADVPTQWNTWVYGSQTAVSANRGIQRRARSWTASTSTMVFSRAWPNAVTAVGEYEVITHRFDRTRFQTAINSAVGKLGLFWWREIVDESLTTLSQTWSYTVPSSQNFFADSIKVLIEVNPDQSTFPYARAEDLGIGYEVREAISTTGTRTLTLQFSNGMLLPPDRTIRLEGVGYFSTLTADTDVLPVAGPWESSALDWIYDYAAFRIDDWMAEHVPAGETEKYRQKALTNLMKEKDTLQTQMMPHKDGRIVVPGQSGVYGGRWGTDWRYLGAFNTPGL